MVNTQVVVVDITVIRRVRLDVTETTTEEEEEEEAAAELITTDAEITATALETNHAIDLVIVLVTDLEIDRETRKGNYFNDDLNQRSLKMGVKFF